MGEGGTRQELRLRRVWVAPHPLRPESARGEGEPAPAPAPHTLLPAQPSLGVWEKLSRELHVPRA